MIIIYLSLNQTPKDDSTKSKNCHEDLGSQKCTSTVCSKCYVQEECYELGKFILNCITQYPDAWPVRISSEGTEVKYGTDENDKVTIYRQLTSNKFIKILNKFNSINKRGILYKNNFSRYNYNKTIINLEQRLKSLGVELLEEETEEQQFKKYMEILGNYTIYKNLKELPKSKQDPIENNFEVYNKLIQSDVDTKSFVEKELLKGQIKYNINVIGDLHGSLFNLIRNLFRLRKQGKLTRNFILKKNDEVEERLVVLGDIIDTGYYSNEIYYILMLLKIINPDLVHIIRGNHEYKTEYENTSIMNSKDLKKEDYKTYNEFDGDNRKSVQTVFGGRESFKRECEDIGVNPDVIFDSYKLLPCALFLGIELSLNDVYKAPKKQRYYQFFHGGFSRYFSTECFDDDKIVECKLVGKKIMDDFMWSDYVHTLVPNFLDVYIKFYHEELKNEIGLIKNSTSLDVLREKLSYIHVCIHDKISSLEQFKIKYNNIWKNLQSKENYVIKLHPIILDYIMKQKSETLKIVEEIISKQNTLTDEAKKESIIKYFDDYTKNYYIPARIFSQYKNSRIGLENGSKDILEIKSAVSELLKTNQYDGIINSLDNILGPNGLITFTDANELLFNVDQNKGTLNNYHQTFANSIANNILFTFRGHQDKIVNSRLFNWKQDFELADDLKDQYVKVSPISWSMFSCKPDESKNHPVQIYEKTKLVGIYKNIDKAYEVFKKMNKQHNVLSYMYKLDFSHIAGMDWTKVFQSPEYNTIRGVKRTDQDNDKLIYVENREFNSNPHRATIMVKNNLKEFFKYFAPLLTLSATESKDTKYDIYVELSYNNKHVEPTQKTPVVVSPREIKEDSISVFENSYYQKYLKYKNKYLQLKKEMKN